MHLISALLSITCMLLLGFADDVLDLRFILIFVHFLPNSNLKRICLFIKVQRKVCKNFEIYLNIIENFP